MLSTAKKSFHKAFPPGPLSTLKAQATLIISVLLVVAGAAGLVFFQKPLQEPQDLRQQASVADGQVQVTATHLPPQDASNQIIVGQQAIIEFKVNTNNVQTDGIQLVFNVVTDAFTTPPELVLTPNVGLQIAYQEIQTVSDGFLVSLIALPSQIGGTFGTNQPTQFLTMKFTPTTTGPVVLNFDADASISTVHNSNPPQDELKTIPTATFTVFDAVQPSPSPSTTPSTSPSASPSPSATPSTSPSASPSPSASAAVSPSPSPSQISQASPTPSPSTGVGGSNLAQCNQSCSDNGDCETNHRCYNGQCRLATNVSSTSCVNPADQGIHRGCNEYCADSRECGSGYTCYFNRCRQPLNLENTICAQPSTTVVQAMAASCNQGCTTHADCGPNLLCYNATKTCRLAINPSSYSCSPSTSTNVASTIYGSKGGTIVTNKGGEAQGGTQGATGSPTTSATPLNGGKSSPTASIVPQGTTSDATTDGDTTPERTAFDSVREIILYRLNSLGVSLPVLMIGVGLGLLLLLLIIAMASRLLRGRGNASSDRLATTSPQAQKYEQELARKIDSLQHQQPRPMSSFAAPGQPAPNQPALGAQSYPPRPTALPPRPAPLNPPSPVTPQAPTGASTPTIADRLHAHGITPPPGKSQNS